MGIYEACTSGCLYVIAFAPCWKLKLPLWGITAEGFFHQQSSALHTPPIAHRPDAFSFASPWNGTLFRGFCTCLKVIRAPFHTWRGPPRWGGMLKQMQQPLKTDSPDLLMLLLCAHTQMCRDVCVGCVCVLPAHDVSQKWVTNHASGLNCGEKVCFIYLFWWSADATCLHRAADCPDPVWVTTSSANSAVTVMQTPAGDAGTTFPQLHL